MKVSSLSQSTIEEVLQKLLCQKLLCQKLDEKSNKLFLVTCHATTHLGTSPKTHKGMDREASIIHILLDTYTVPIKI